VSAVRPARGWCALLCCAFILGGAASAAAAPADLDRAFGGGDGITEITGPTGSLPGEAGARMALGPRDEIYVLYSRYAPCDPPFGCTIELTVVRYTPNGGQDPSFAASPQLTVKGTPYVDDFDLAVGPDGKPVIAAYGGPEGRLQVARIGLDGRLDPSFGVGGIAPPSKLAIESSRDVPKVAVQADGKVLVSVAGGKVGDATSFSVARYLADGQPDPGFGFSGEAAPLVSTQTRPAGIFVNAAGGITVPAPLCCLGGTPMYGEGFTVARLLPDGQSDPGWAGDGSLFFPTAGAEGTVEAAAPTRDGGLFLSYEASTPMVSTVGNVIKLTPAGALDPSFGKGSGALRLFNRVGSVSPSDLTVDANGRLLGVGWDGRIAVFRLRPDGSKDRTFNGGERLLLPYGGGGTTEYQVGVQSNGRIVAFGDSGLGAFKRFALIGLRGGDDRTRCLGKRATIVGTRKKDRLVGTPNRDVIAALAGADEVRGLGGADLICGGKGRDRLFGGPGKNVLRP
jgi:serralysin